MIAKSTITALSLGLCLGLVAFAPSQAAPAVRDRRGGSIYHESMDITIDPVVADGTAGESSKFTVRIAPLKNADGETISDLASAVAITVTCASPSSGCEFNNGKKVLNAFIAKSGESDELSVTSEIAEVITVAVSCVGSDCGPEEHSLLKNFIPRDITIAPGMIMLFVQAPAGSLSLLRALPLSACSVFAFF